MANLLEKSSIVLTPTGYSEDAIHNVKPSSEPFGDMGLIKNGTSTRINSQGLVETVAAHTPRIDYSKGEGAILVELVGTNQLRYSEDLTQSSVWSSAGGSRVLLVWSDPTRRIQVRCPIYLDIVQAQMQEISISSISFNRTRSRSFGLGL